MTQIVAAPDADRFETHLQALLERRGDATQVTGGTVELVGSNSAGSAPDGSSNPTTERIRRLATLELQKQLEEADAYGMCNASTFLICFAQVGRREAERKVQAISQRIGQVVAQEFPAMQDRVEPEPFVAELRQAVAEAGRRHAHR